MFPIWGRKIFSIWKWKKLCHFKWKKTFSIWYGKSLVTNWLWLAKTPILKVALFDKFWTISQKQLWKQEKWYIISKQIQITFWNGKNFFYLQMAKFLPFQMGNGFHRIEKTSSGPGRWYTIWTSPSCAI